MYPKLALMVICVLVFFPGVQGQIQVPSHNISFQLEGDFVLVEEVLLFLNPPKSDVHTFDQTIALLRGGIEELEIKGVSGRFNNESLPNIIYLDFSKSPIYRSASENSRVVTLSYRTRDYTDRIDADGRSLYVFKGNAMLPLPPDLEVGDTRMTFGTGQGLWFGRILPTADVVGGKVKYRMSDEDRKNFAAFNTIIEYGDFNSWSKDNVEKIESNLEEANTRGSDAESAILNALVYDADTSVAEFELNRSQALENRSKELLSIINALFDKGAFYDAYLISNNTLKVSREAVLAAESSQREANIQLRLALNQKISRLENLTVPTPAPTIAPSLNETNLSKKPSSPPPLTPTVTPIPPEDLEIPNHAQALSTKTALIALLFIGVIVALLIMKKGERGGRKIRHTGIGDFRSISDLKRKSYKDFEDKLVDVKKETDIAGEIRDLEKEKRKYVLGIENLDKKMLAGEIDPSIYKAEKSKFETQVKMLEGRINSLQKELPKRGAFHGKGLPDKAKGNK